MTGAARDRAAVKTHDIGLTMRRDATGAPGFEVFVGGGQGRTPMIAETIRPFLPIRHLLSYLEAILRVYNQLGRRDNIYKARIKILVGETGMELFRDMVEEEWERIREGALLLPDHEIERIRAHFAPPPYERLEDASDAHPEDPDFVLWARRCVVAHKVPGYAIVNISLKPVGGVPGDVTAGQMEALALLADQYSFGEIRVAHEQNLVFAHVRQADLPALWRALGDHDLATPNVGLVSDIIACPSLDYCNLANARSIPVARGISDRFADMRRQHDIGELTVNVSGCINACGHHHVANIGILGVDKKGREFYQVTLGGRADEDAAIGGIIGPAFAEDEIVDAVESVIAVYLDHRADGEDFVETYARIGDTPFREKLYATD